MLVFPSSPASNVFLARVYPVRGVSLVLFPLLLLIGGVYQSAVASTSSSFTTVSTSSTPCLPSLSQRSSTNGDAMSSSYFSSEAGPSGLCLANQRNIQSSPREMWDRDTDSSSEPMVPSPPAIEDIDVMVRELLLGCDNNIKSQE